MALNSCDTEKKVRPSNAMDTGRAFIRASLDGDFGTAEELILKDSVNTEMFKSFKSFYQRMDEDLRKNYHNSSYEINKFLEENDSITIINYSNSYMQKPMDIKVVRQAGQWWVDFKYAYSGNLPIN
jgi:hypothetical protein